VQDCLANSSVICYGKKTMQDDSLQQLSDLLEKKLAPIAKKLDKHEKLLRSIKKDQDTMLKMLDNEQMSQRKRISRIEEQFGLPGHA
jgi:uncharacterized protein (DUF2225 family)